MTLYADTPVRRILQVDLMLVLGIAGAIWLSDVVHDKTMGLATPGRRIDESATGLAARLREAGEKVGGVPVVGDQVRSPLDGAGSAADRLAAAGQSQVDAVQTLAFWLALAFAVVPIALVLVGYLPFRIRFIRRATAGRRFLDSGADLDLFALRAMTNQPLHVLAKVSADPAGAWRVGDHDVVHRLAELELRDSGLRLPARLAD